MKVYEVIKNKLLVACDPEIRAIKSIVEGTRRNYSGDSNVIEECDQVFIQRLAINPKAFKMSFWESHFELASFSHYPQIQGRILDFGCGSGHLDIILARSGRIIHGIDMSPVGIGIAGFLKGNEKKEVQNRLSFSVADVTKDTPDGELFDAAWSAHVFEHIADPAPILNGLRNWLKPGAYLLISVPLGNAYDDPGHVNHFPNTQELAAFLNGNVTIERMDISAEYQVIRALCKMA